MIENLKNLYDAYRNPVELYRETSESFTKLNAVRTTTSGQDQPSWPSRFSTANAGEKDVYRVISTSMKLVAVPFLLHALYRTASVAYNKCFTYKSLFFAAITFTIGHDTARAGHMLSREYVMSWSDRKKDEEDRDYQAYGLEQPCALFKGVAWLGSNAAGLALGAEALEAKHTFLVKPEHLMGQLGYSNDRESDEGDSGGTQTLKGRLYSDVAIASSGTITQAAWNKAADAYAWARGSSED